MQKILLIDDDKRVTDTMKTILGTVKDYRVYTASSGRAGLRSALLRKPHLIVLDVMMPDMDGISVLERLKAHRRTRRIPVLMLTGTTDPDAVKKSMYWYADEYIAKPISPKELLAKVTRRLSKTAPSSASRAAGPARGKRATD